MANAMNSYKNAITKESIFTALMIIMEKKDFHKISVTEVTAKAGVSRMAFYRNYEVLEDVITDYLNDCFAEYEKAIERVGLYNSYEVVLLFFSTFKAEKTLLLNLIESKLTYLLLDKCNTFLEDICKTIVCDKSYSPEKEKYTIKFLTGGFFNILIEWIMNDFNESEEYMAELFYEYCK
ncbi:TetR/AcrR family transcriptional regulator [Candidatus Enterococcus murrayae]|uniref:TetR/AcrR family transcriptional regulator n=1 Tax=Candidatus Enterococcus murrayae TaxID=2815321 RepID=A0ABS3HEJ6_9ENTE|nr:TetR/AcrR family transcriptional regulator [Enterococcus sp. MJM16]MBO0451880.1 TetR/AcrR family transcriptional regulator [Enterococcus sp. MJM16]